MQRAQLLIVTAVTEVGIGMLLLLWPAVPAALLLGVKQLSPEAALLGRVAGAALLAIGVACWLARTDRDCPAQRGLTIGVLIYDVALGTLLAYAGLRLGMAGVALWPGVLIHSALAVWCVVSLRTG